MASRRATSLRRASALVSTSCGFGSGQVEIWFGGVNVLGGGGRRSANERRQYLVRHRARVEGRHHRLVLRLDPVAGVDQQQRAAQHVHAAGLEIGEAHLGGRCVGWVGEVSRGCRGKGYARMKRPIQEAHPLTSIHRSRSASGALRCVCVCVCGGGGGRGRLRCCCHAGQRIHAHTRGAAGGFCQPAQGRHTPRSKQASSRNGRTYPSSS